MIETRIICDHCGNDITAAIAKAFQVATAQTKEAINLVEEQINIADKLQIDVVPIVGYGTLQEGIDLVRSGFGSTVSPKDKYIAEGLVMRPVVELLNRMGHRIITKAKHRDFIQ